MLANTEDEKELRREIYSLRRELRQDLKKVRALSKDDILLPKTALKQMTKAEAVMRKKAVKYMELPQLQSVYRKLRHIREIKSSTYEGATSQVQHLVSIIPTIRNLSKPQLDKLWEAYDKLVGQNLILKDYKYQVYGSIIDVITNTRISAEELAIRVDELYDKATRGVLDEKDYKDKTTKLLIQSFKPILPKH